MSVSESKLYEHFVDRTLSEVALGLQLDNAQVGSKKRKVHDALVRRNQSTAGTRGAAQKVVEGRFILGGDDASYLASGLACLWSTVGAGGDGGGADALTLAPASLYAPDAVNGIRQGLLRALELRNEETQREAPKRLPMLMRLLATVVDFVPDVPTATTRILSTGTVRNAKEREMLLAFLRELKAIMTDASDSLSDPEASLARRILNGSRAGSRASMQRIRRLDEAERANDRLMKQYNEALAEWKGEVTAEREAYNEKLKKMEARFEAGRALALSAAVNKAVRTAEEQVAHANTEITKAETEVKAKDASIESLKEQMKVKERELQWQYQQLAQFNMAHAEEMQAAKRAYDAQVNDLEAAKTKANEEKTARRAETRKVNERNTEIRNLKKEHKKALKDKNTAFQLEKRRMEAEKKKCEKDLKGAQDKFAAEAAAKKVAMAAAKAEKQKELGAAQQRLMDVQAECVKAIEEMQRKGQEDYEKQAATAKATIAAIKAAKEEELGVAQTKLRDALAEHGTAVEALKLKCKEDFDEEAAKLKRDAAAQKAQLDEELKRKQNALDECLREKEAAMAAAEAAVSAAEDSGSNSNNAQRLLAEQKALYEEQKREQDENCKQLEQECRSAKGVLQLETAKKEKALLATHDAESAKQDEMIAELRASLEATKERVDTEKAQAALVVAQKAAEMLAEHDAESAKRKETIAELTTSLEATNKRVEKEQVERAREAEALLVDHINETAQRDAMIARLEEELKATQEASDRRLKEAQDAAALAVKEAAEAQAATEQTVKALDDETAARRDALDLTVIALEKNLAEAKTRAAAKRAALAKRKAESAAAIRKRQAEIDADASLSDAKKTNAKVSAIAAAKEALKPPVEELKLLEKTVEQMEEEVQQKRTELAGLDAPPATPFTDRIIDRVKGGDQPSALPKDDARQVQKNWLDKMMGDISTDDDDSSTTANGDDTPINAFADDAYSLCAVIRGLVGQRGPTEDATCAHDGLLPYALPNLNDFVKRAVPVRALLESSDDPTEEEVAKALTPNSAKRQKISTGESPAVAAEAFEAFDDNFAIIGSTPVAELPEERHGIETPHEVRWMPQGERGEAMARVAVLEHAIARCKQVAESSEAGEEATRALRRAGAALKFQQMEELYELNEAAEFEDDPHPLGTEARLVTRPCAMVRGTLSYPTDPGVHPIASGAADQPLSGSVDLANAITKAAAETATLRNELRREGHASHFYVAPPADKLDVVKIGGTTGAVADVAQDVADAVADATKGAVRKVFGGETSIRASERLRPSDYSTDTWARVINRAIVAAAALSFDGDQAKSGAPDAIAAFIDMNKSRPNGAGEVTAQSRRDGLWTEMLRHVAIAQDRLWIFIRLMSGGIGGDVTEVITMADAATLKAAKAIQDQRLEISKRVSDMQAKIVETVVASMLKKSEMTMSLANDEVAVIDAEAKKKLQELASGASGRPFFEANVALKNLSEASDNPPSLQEVLKSLANVGEHMQSTLEQTLAEPGAASASLVELSHPSNSYFVSLRTDAVAAIRTAHEMLNAELGSLGGRRRLTLWELVEGGCQVLTNRFATLCGYILVQARTSTGVSAMYVSHQVIYTNASQARNALAKLVAAATVYIARVSVPAFDAIDSQVERFRVLEAGERVTDIAVTARSAAAPRPALTAPISGSGWWNEGGRRH